MLVDDWAIEMAATEAGQAADAAEHAAPSPAEAEPAVAAAGMDVGADADALLVSPGSAAPCWAEVAGAGFASADPAWQAASMDFQQQQQLQQQGGVLAAEAAVVHGAASTRVERIYSSKRSWVTQQIATSTSTARAATPCDSAVTGTAAYEQMSEDCKQWRLERSSSGLPGAAGPAGSEGCGFPGLFSAPTACLAAAGGAAGSISAAREMHTCPLLCDSNRLVGGAGPGPGSGLRVQQAAVAGSKRKSPGSTQHGPLEPSSAAAAAAVSRCGSLPSSQALTFPTASLTVLALGPESAVQASCAPAAAGVSVAAPAQHAEVAAPEETTAQDDVAMQTDTAPAGQEQVAQLEGAQKRQKLEAGAGVDTAAAATAEAPVPLQAIPAAFNAILGAVSSGVAAAGHAGVGRLAPAPSDKAAAAAQMPPPAAHLRPHSATSTDAPGSGCSAVKAAQASPAVAAPAAPVGGAGPASAPASAAVSGDASLQAPAMSAAPVVAVNMTAPVEPPSHPAGLASSSASGAALPSLQALSGSLPLLPQPGQQQLQPSLAQQQLWRLLAGNAAHQLPLGVGAPGVVGGVVPGAGLGLPLPLQGLPSLPGIAAQLPQLLTQQQQHTQLGLAGLWPTAPAALRPWAAAVGARPLAPAQGVGVGVLPSAVLPGGGLLAPFAAGLQGLHAHHPLVAALNGAGAVLFGGSGADAGGLMAGAGGGGFAGGGGRRHQGEGSEQADSCLP